MKPVTQEEPRLPTQYPLKAALIIYTKRLLVLFFVALLTIYLFALYLVSNQKFASSEEGHVVIVAILFITSFILQAFLVIYRQIFSSSKYDQGMTKRKGDSPSVQRKNAIIHKLMIEFEELKDFAARALFSLVDGAFLVIWSLVQVLVDRISDELQLFGVDSSVLVTIQLVFAIVTLLPILGHLFRNISRGLTQDLKSTNEITAGD